MIRIWLVMWLLRSLGLAPQLELRKHDPDLTKVARGKLLHRVLDKGVTTSVRAGFRALKTAHIQPGHENRLALYCVLGHRESFEAKIKAVQKELIDVPTDYPPLREVSVEAVREGQHDQVVRGLVSEEGQILAGSIHVCDSDGPLVESGGRYHQTCSECGKHPGLGPI